MRKLEVGWEVLRSDVIEYSDVWKYSDNEDMSVRGMLRCV